MPPCGSFHYCVVVPEAPGRAFGPWRMEQVDAPFWTGNPMEDYRLVGLSPLLTFAEGRIKLQASSRERAGLAAALFDVDPELFSVVQAGDVLHLSRDQCGGIALSVLRGDQLIFAVGAVLSVPLGAEVQIHSAWELAMKAEAVFKEVDPSFELPELPFEIVVRGQRRLLIRGCLLDPYDFHVIRASPRMEGSYEVVAVKHSGIRVRKFLIATANLLNRENAGLQFVEWPSEASGLP